jgi:alpha-glucosidase (family GH31 glycosyl hydrolase)
MFGPDYLVAPVLAKGVTARKVCLGFGRTVALYYHLSTLYQIC